MFLYQPQRIGAEVQLPSFNIALAAEIKRYNMYVYRGVFGEIAVNLCCSFDKICFRKAINVFHQFKKKSN